MGTEIDELTWRIDERLRAAGTSDRTESERRYLKSEIEHYGVTVGQTRRIVRDEVRAWAQAEGQEVADRGRIRPDVWDAYRVAHPDTRTLGGDR